jgi:hypothetical protein
VRGSNRGRLSEKVRGVVSYYPGKKQEEESWLQKYQICGRQ